MAFERQEPKRSKELETVFIKICEEIKNPKYLKAYHTITGVEDFSPRERYTMDLYDLRNELRMHNAPPDLIELLPFFDSPPFGRREADSQYKLVQPKYDISVTYTDDEIMVTAILVLHGLLPSHSIREDMLKKLLFFRLSAVERLAEKISQKKEKPHFYSAQPEMWTKLHESKDFPRFLLRKYQQPQFTENTVSSRLKGFLSTTRKLMKTGHNFQKEFKIILELLTTEYTSQEHKKMLEDLDRQRYHLRSLAKDSLGVTRVVPDKMSFDKNFGYFAHLQSFRLPFFFPLLEKLAGVHCLEYEKLQELKSIILNYDTRTAKDITQREYNHNSKLLETLYRDVFTAETLELAFEDDFFARLPTFVKEFFFYLYFLKKSKWKILSVRDFVTFYKKDQKDKHLPLAGHVALQVAYLDLNGKATEIQFTSRNFAELDKQGGDHTLYKAEKSTKVQEAIFNIITLLK